MVKKSKNAYRNISEASEIIGVKAHVLRFWETKFETLNPMTRGGGRRFYSPEEIELLKTIKELLYERGMTIKAASGLIDRYGTNAIYLAPKKVKTDGDPEPASQAAEAGKASVDAQSVSANPETNSLKAIDSKLEALERKARTDVASLKAMLQKLDQVA